MDAVDRLGIVTVTFNSGQVIHDFMQSVLKQTHSNFILYVVDNASSDGTLQSIREYSDPRIKITENSTNVGVAEGNNIGIRTALNDGCYAVLLLNNDTVFDSSLFIELIKGQEHYKCPMVVPKILFYEDRNRIWSAGGYFSRYRGSARHFGYGQLEDGRFDQPRKISYNPTCCMLIKSEVFGQVGLMDAAYFVYFDDTDFCRRAQDQHVDLMYIPTARLLHKAGSLTGIDSDFTIRYSTRNHVYYLLKNFPAWELIYYLPAFQLHLLFKYLLTWRRPQTYWLAQESFREGFLLFARSRTAEQEKLLKADEHGLIFRRSGMEKRVPWK